MRKIILILIILALIPMVSYAQVSVNFWKYGSSILQPILNTWQLKIPQMGGSGTSCVQVDNTGLFSVTGSACGTGGSGGGSGTFATSTAFGTTLLNYPLNATDVVMIGSTGATSTAKMWFNPNTNTSFFNGNVGIGTTNPTGKLQVEGGQVSFGGAPSGSSWLMTLKSEFPWTALDSTGTAVFELYGDGKRMRLLNGTRFEGYNQDLTLGTQTNTNSMTIKFTTGNTGIGTTSPWKLLSVGDNNTGTFAISTSTAGCASFSSMGELFSTGSACGTGSGGTSAYEIATTSSIAVPQLSYFTNASGRTTLGGVATTTLTASSPLSLDNPVAKVGGSNSILTCTTAASGVAGCLSNTAFDTFNNKEPAISAGTINDYWRGDKTFQATSTLRLTKSQITDFGTYESVLTFGLPMLRTANTINWVGLATTSQPSSSNILTSNGSAGVYGTATSTLSATTPLTGSFTQVGSGGTLGIQVANTSQNGYLSNTDWNTFNGKQATISATWPITLTGAAVGFNGLSTSTAAVVGNIPYFSGVNTFANVATGTITCAGTASCSTTGLSVLGGNLTITGSSSGGSGVGTISTSTSPTIGNLAYWTTKDAYPEKLGTVGTTTLTLSGFPANIPSTLGAFVGGSNTTWTWWGLATTSQPASSNLLVSNGGAGVYGVGTSTLNASAPITGSFTQVGSGGSLGCTTASSGVTGCLSGTDWTTFNNKGAGTVTSITLGGGLFGTSPLTTTGTIYGAVATSATPIISPAGIAYWTGVGNGTTPAKLGTAATTTLTATAPLALDNAISVIGGTASTLTCTAATGSVAGCLSAANWTTFNSKLGSYDAWSPHNTVGLSATTSAIAISTTTNPALYPITSFSATLPQLSLSAGANIAQWTMRNAGGNLYFSTTTVAGTATSTPPALTLFNSGEGLYVGSSSPSSAFGQFLFTAQTAATTTITEGRPSDSTSKVCHNTKTSAGTNASWFINAAGTMVVELSLCK